ncbi:hypothetical protein [Vibrio cyclitrophicus]|uniref:hypothetical protein n=1 Tax=Vibrio cyclitrophicus TaxID=47951 RepID=UPI0002FCB85C|nr:hypothetical protein [Vibrio cyclitrophicus]OEF30697.1 DUF2326 domain-containing protein [Vibrio cyclitrophicus 1F97]OEF39550.1 DUF2326 domain-containing protein [Vibrio cyclitrophicus 1F273]OEF79607.1 DUF2326 domain-containing protein [Vibrio cyclitrophicus 1F111]
MKLLKLTTKVDGTVIREFKFNDSLSIITNKRDSSLSGNQIGKSVPGRIIDYLLDGTISPIYIDDEFGTSEPNIQKLFDEHEVTSSLSYIGLDGKVTVIKRRLAIKKSDGIYYINGKTKSNKEYTSHILKTMFNVHSAKPALRKLAPKFLRTDANRMTKTVKFNDDRFKISQADRNTVFLYLFNFGDTDILTEIQSIKTFLKNYENKLTSFSGIIRDDKITGTIKKTQKELNKLEKSLLLSEDNNDKLAIIDKINDIDNQQNRLSDEVLELDLKINNIKKTQKLFENNKNHHLLYELETIYGYAEVRLGSVVKDYDSVLKFHNHLVETKTEFITDGLDKLEERHNISTSKLKTLNGTKSSLYQELKSKKKIEEISETVKTISELNKKLIQLNAIVEKKNSIETRLGEETKKLKKLSEKLTNELSNVDAFETEFKNHFKTYTNTFYGVEYNFNLNLNRTNGDCQPTVDDIQSNNDGGLKRLEAITFDLSYIKAVDSLNLLRPTFVVHDSIDEVDIKHIRQLFDDSIKLSGQQVVSMLVSQLEDTDYEKYKNYIVLELSEEDKYFKV